jgi:MoaA/NifB/PqqE/SkfB family radical SAM enzyme
MNEQLKRSFTAAGSMPWKLLQIKEQCLTPDRRIIPIHIQLVPTNRCNGTCPWCSCSEVDRSLELSMGEIRELIEFFAARGTRAVTITGGGEPTLHPNFLEIIAEFKKYGISIGLVSNGIKWGKSEKIEGAEFLSGTLEWLRVSTMDTTINGAQPDWLDNIARQLRTHFGVSFTCGEGVNVELATRIAGVVQRHSNATHIRFVQDILNPNDDRLREIEAATKTLTSKGIYQYRSEFTRGAEECHIALLKPMINADGHIYPCCGVQYANDELGLRTMPKAYDMGSWRDYDTLSAFNGSVCKKCYYEQYNTTLAGLLQRLQSVYHV